jgi:hypothetical protein
MHHKIPTPYFPCMLSVRHFYYNYILVALILLAMYFM